jgi:hypothetical protein
MLVLPLLVSAVLVAVAVMIQIGGLAALIWVMRRRAPGVVDAAYVMRQMGVILAVVMGLFAIHAGQVWLYAVVYLGLGEFATFEEALYFSTSSFTTVGYGEIVMESRWRIVPAVQSAAGFLFLGWSTMFLISVLSRMRSIEMDWLNGRDRRAAANDPRDEGDGKPDA